jgi:putative ABC transport system permease protein
MRGQAIAIALVLACGVAMYVAYFSTFDSLQRTRAAYYADNRFADLFAGAKRAPRSLLGRIQTIDGVAQANVRVVVDVTADLAGVTEPITARLISMRFPREPASTTSSCAAAASRSRPSGRGARQREFCECPAPGPGDRVGAVINGHHRDLQIVGIALSPELCLRAAIGRLAA